jgi:exopolysaccharide production protein ExoY
MSCVGPRPIVADELQRYSSQSAEYLKARPGLTGMWQISGRNRLDYADRVALDCHYIRNWSIWIDLMILCKTTFAIMKFDETA